MTDPINAYTYDAERQLNDKNTEAEYWRARAIKLAAENERLMAALERLDDRKNPMLPRSVMARIAKEALDGKE